MPSDKKNLTSGLEAFRLVAISRTFPGVLDTIRKQNKEKLQADVWARHEAYVEPFDTLTDKLTDMGPFPLEDKNKLCRFCCHTIGLPSNTISFGLVNANAGGLLIDGNIENNNCVAHNPHITSSLPLKKLIQIKFSIPKTLDDPMCVKIVCLHKTEVVKTKGQKRERYLTIENISREDALAILTEAVFEFAPVLTKRFESSLASNLCGNWPLPAGPANNLQPS